MPENPNTEDPAYWEKILQQMGLPAELPTENPNMTQVPLGDGLGRKNPGEENNEDSDVHSRMCPIILRPTNTDPLGTRIDRPGERPVEEEVLGQDE